MGTFVKRLLAVVGVVIVLTVGIGYTRYVDAINVKHVSFADTQALVVPHLQVVLPDSDEPRPAVLMFHGCGGVKPSLLRRARELAERGYVAVVVDSYKGRNIDWERVCAGREMFGDQRAADVLVALEYARHHEAIDARRLFIAGYSHGGWTVLESLAYNGALPRGLVDSPDNPLAGVRGVIAWYPYCGIATHFRSGWEKDIPVLMLLAAEDEVTDHRPCAEVAQRQAQMGLPVDWQVFENVGHGFDTGEDWVIRDDADVLAQARAAQLHFLDVNSG